MISWHIDGALFCYSYSLRPDIEIKIRDSFIIDIQFYKKAVFKSLDELFAFFVADPDTELVPLLDAGCLDFERGRWDTLFYGLKGGQQPTFCRKPIKIVSKSENYDLNVKIYEFELSKIQPIKIMRNT
jgi:hypothetical protein